MRGIILIIFMFVGCIPSDAAPQKAGAVWCQRFAGDDSIGSLNQSFKPRVRDFIDALREGGARVRITSGKRPEQRQYLMHWSWRICRELFWFETTRPCTGIHWFPPAVPGYSGDMTMGIVEIVWRWDSFPSSLCTIRNCTQRCAAHQSFCDEALAASGAMTDRYNLVHRPARHSRHNEGNAIDMIISWDGVLNVIQKDGNVATIESLPRNNSNRELHAIGATYGVIKLVSDPPNWSSDGH